MQISIRNCHRLTPCHDMLRQLICSFAVHVCRDGGTGLRLRRTTFVTLRFVYRLMARNYFTNKTTTTAATKSKQETIGQRSAVKVLAGFVTFSVGSRGSVMVSVRECSIPLRQSMQIEPRSTCSTLARLKRLPTKHSALLRCLLFLPPDNQ